jgi:phosphatidylserine/phosphatidylglycerophosphate/cardiolipin synthase-like enzyme
MALTRHNIKAMGKSGLPGTSSRERRVIGAVFLFCSTVLLFALSVAIRVYAGEVQACFVPTTSEDCDPLTAVLKAINGARSTIRIQMYSLTLTEIVNALVGAHRRGVDVRLIVDRSQLHDDRSDALRVTSLVSKGVPVMVDTVSGLMHNKVMVIDGETVLTGSFNYTAGAERWNAENLLVVHDPALAAEYTRYWDNRAAQSRALVAHGATSAGPVVGNRRSMIYEWPGCRYYGKIAPRNRVEFPDPQSAEAAGYRPAGNCR